MNNGIKTTTTNSIEGIRRLNRRELAAAQGGVKTGACGNIWGTTEGGRWGYDMRTGDFGCYVGDRRIKLAVSY